MNFACLLFFLAGARSISEAQGSPVAKVVALLNDMKSQLETEKKEDEELFEKLDCWCTKNRKEKGSAVSEATAHATQLEHDIKRLTAKEAMLKESIASTEKEVDDDTNALAEATSMRKKEAAEFNTNENDMVSSIMSLTNAVTVLSKHNSFLQTDVRTSVKEVKAKNDALIAQILGDDQYKALDNFVQANPYNAQSGQIFGILKQMKENFEANLKEMRENEAKSVADFGELKTAKTTEISEGNAKAKSDKQKLAATVVELSDAKEDLEDTTEQMSADEAFLADLEKRCKVSDAEWEERQKTRSLEIAAVGETITILTDDDAKDTMKAAVGGFIQLSSSRRKMSVEERRRKAAARVIEQAASKRNNMALTQLAATVHLDAFEKVKKAMDEMVAALKKEMAEEVKHKDFCNEALQDNEIETTKKTHEAEDLQVKIDKLAAAIETSDKELVTLADEVKQMQIELKGASDNRISENMEFQQTVADQRATQVILKKALARLAKFYSFTQTAVRSHVEEVQGQAPPPGFSAYKKNAASGSVMTMIEGIITDSSNLEKEAIKAEQDAQSAYEEFVKNSNASLDEAQRNIVSKQEVKATGESDKAGAVADLEKTQDDIKGLSNENSELHASCDFVLKNFDIRQKARGEEIESIAQAKMILSGA